MLLVLILYGPIMILALCAPGEAPQVVAIDFFADTLLFAGAVLALAKAMPTEPVARPGLAYSSGASGASLGG